MSNEEQDRLRRQQAALAKALTRSTEEQASLQEPSLAGLDTGEIARSAETLVRKRISQTRAVLRGTARILGEEFPKEFRVFASTHFFNGPDAIWQDAVEFTKWIGHRRTQPAWLPDTLKWERARCLWEYRTICFSLFRLRYGIAAWIDKAGPIAPESMRHWVLVWRLGRRGGIRAYPRRRGSST
jgi:hypothetical protein